MNSPALDTRSVDGPTGSLSVLVSGSPGPEETVVLVHPINTAASVWAPVMAALDRPSVALDLRGHGSSTQQGPFDVDGYVDDVLAVLDGLDLESVHLAGGSLGGSIGLALAARCPERARSVTTFGSTLGTGVPDEAIQAMIDELDAKGTEKYFADLGPLIVGAAYREDRRVLDALAVAAGARPEPVVAGILRGAFGADIRKAVAGLRTPVSAVGGTEDPTCPMVMTEEIAAAASGTVTVLRGVGHLPMLEVPERVAELIAAHVK
ncbi:MAG TPA: alpha/beta fold hydrolase [Pseudonocardia sp.]